LGRGGLDGPWLVCPWHGFEFDPKTGRQAADYSDPATPLPLEVRPDGIYVGLDEPEPTRSEQRNKHCIHLHKNSGN
jgi:hypothetical protein